MIRVANYRVLENFPAARQKLITKYPNASRASSNLKISKELCYSLFDNEIKDFRFRESTQEKIIKHFFSQPDEILFNLITKAVNQYSAEFDSIEKYVGKYRYFRNNVQGVLVDGVIEVFLENGYYKFNHYNTSISDPDFDERRPDHSGIFVLLGTRIYLVGIGARYIRPVVANVVDNLHIERIEGVVIAVRKDAGELFSARFIMVHESHSEFAEPNNKAYAKRIKAQNGMAGVLIVGGD